MKENLIKDYLADCECNHLMVGSCEEYGCSCPRHMHPMTKVEAEIAKKMDEHFAKTDCYACSTPDSEGKTYCLDHGHF